MMVSFHFHPFSFHPFSFSSTLFFPLIWLCLFPEKCVMVFSVLQIQEVIRGTKDALSLAQVCLLSPMFVKIYLLILVFGMWEIERCEKFLFCPF